MCLMPSNPAVENDDKAGKNPEKIHDFVAAIKS